MKDVWKAIYIFLFGALIVLAVTHAKGFATSVGSLFTGVNALGVTLTGSNTKSGS
jgi:hypothetical protein